jgi:hypothetical protein
LSRHSSPLKSCSAKPERKSGAFNNAYLQAWLL